ESIADFVQEQPEILAPVLDDLASLGVLNISVCSICPECDVPLEGQDAPNGQIECDLCAKRYRDDAIEQEQCYILIAPVVATSPQIQARNRSEGNPLGNAENLERAGIRPWKIATEDEYTI